MKNSEGLHIARFRWKEKVRWGVVEGKQVYALSGDLYASPKRGRALCVLPDVRLLAPLEPTNKVVGIAVNYGDRAGRDGPGLFMKPPGTNIAHLDRIVYPRICTRVVHEAEMGIVIGKKARKVSPKKGLDYVLGYTCVNDVSAVDMTTSDVGAGTSMRVKYFDTFCPIGPVIATGLDGDNLRLQCRVNGKTEVDASTSQMLWNVGELVAWVSEVMTLNPGDVLSSACPGYGDIKAGDTVEVEVEGIGVLRNKVVAEQGTTLHPKRAAKG